MSGFFHRLGFGRRYAVGQGHSPYGPVPPGPEDKARNFQPLAVEREEEISEKEARQRRQDRLEQILIVRRIHAVSWMLRRKVSGLHRRLPLRKVAAFYLVVAGVLCFALANPLMKRVVRTAEPIPAAKPPEGISDSISRITRLIAEKNFPQALAETQTLESEYPNDVRTFLAKGTALAALRDYDAAREAFQKAKELSPDSPGATMNLAEIEFVLGHYPEAEALYRTLANAQPKNALLVFRLYLCARMQKNAEGAAIWLRSPVIGTHSLEWHYLHAAEALFNGQESEAAKILNKARILYGERTRGFDKSLVRLGLLKNVP